MPFVDAGGLRHVWRFAGRGRGSHAYYHSLQADHHVFINLLNEKVPFCPLLPGGACGSRRSAGCAVRATDDLTVAGQVYCLPDGYEVQDPSLDDIKVIAQHAGTCAASDGSRSGR